MSATPNEIWCSPRNWADAPTGFLFLAPAISQIAVHLLGDAWKDDYGATDYLRSTPTPEAADENLRDWAHQILTSLGGLDYVPKLQTLPQLGRLGEPTIEVRAGYNFTQPEWDTVLKYVSYHDKKIEPIIGLVRQVATWVRDAIFNRQLTPYLMKLAGGGWGPGDPDDWIVPNIDVIRKRISHCRMQPGRPSSFAGSHWIFLKREELDLLLASQRPSPRVASTVESQPSDIAREEGMGWNPENDLVSQAEGQAPQPGLLYDSRGRALTEMRLNIATALQEHYGTRGGKGATFVTPQRRYEVVNKWRLQKENREKALPATKRDVKRMIEHLDKHYFV